MIVWKRGGEKNRYSFWHLHFRQENAPCYLWLGQLSLTSPQWLLVGRGMLLLCDSFYSVIIWGTPGNLFFKRIWVIIEKNLSLQKQHLYTDFWSGSVPHAQLAITNRLGLELGFGLVHSQQKPFVSLGQPFPTPALQFSYPIHIKMLCIDYLAWQLNIVQF